MTHIIIFSSRSNGMQSKKNSHTENTTVLIRNKMAFIFLDTQEIDKILYDSFDKIRVKSAACWTVEELNSDCPLFQWPQLKKFSHSQETFSYVWKLLFHKALDDY